MTLGVCGGTGVNVDLGVAVGNSVNVGLGIAAVVECRFAMAYTLVQWSVLARPLASVLAIALWLGSVMVWELESLSATQLM